MTTQSPLRHDYGLCDPATCWWCELDRGSAEGDTQASGAATEVGPPARESTHSTVVAPEPSADDLRERFYDRYVGDERD